MKVNVTSGQDQLTEFELIPGSSVYIEYHGGGGSLYYRWEDLSEDLREKLQKLNDNFSRQIENAFSMLLSGVPSDMG